MPRRTQQGIAIVPMRSLFNFVLAAVCIWGHSSPLQVLAADNSTKSAQISVLHLSNGDYVTGTLVNCPDAECLSWQSPVFASPLQFPIDGVAAIHFTPPSVLPQPEGAYGFELAGGDLLFGALVSLDSHAAVLEIQGIGRMNMDRSIILRIYRRGGSGDQLFVGPTGLQGWQTSGPQNGWREDAGHLIADKPNAVLRRDFGIPERVRFEFELSWNSHPDFEFAIGVGDGPESVARAFKFEVWESEIVIQRETEKDADVANLKSVAASGGGRLHVQAFLDQAQGRMLVFSSNGIPLADLKVKTAKAKTFGGIQLTNRKGDVRLERLQIGSWNGEPPRNLELDKSRIHATDGTITYGVLKSFDAEKREFVVGDDAESHVLAEDSVQDVFLSQPTETPRALRAVYLSGMKVSGDLVRVEDQKMWLKSPGVHEPIAIPLESLQSVVVLKSKGEPPELPQRKGRLEINGITLQGCLVECRVGEASGLAWQPARSTKSSPIQKGIPGRIVYREPPPTPPVQADGDQQAVQGVVVMNAPRAIQRRTKDPQTGKSSKVVGSVLHLRTGDMIPCEAISIDEQGLTFKSAISGATFVPHRQIQALELLPNVTGKGIDPGKKSRLLTVPRMQRTNPPTHLIRSAEGDYLRGRLVSMDAEQIQVELRLDAKIIPRGRVARILWLHPEALDTDAKPDGAAVAEYANLVQALLSDGNRVTFVPEQVAGSILSGKSELLGVCPVDLQNVDQLFMGTAIDQATANLPFQWKLKKSAEPLGTTEGSEGSGDGGEGQESTLVGKPAPEIGLKTVDGTSFQLSSHKGKVVILDFWASWCGPCLQVMPQIDRVAHEFVDQEVELFAINLEETPEKVKAALERLKLSTTVLLDRDGRIAEKYGATSIPQTVIVGRDGKVARLFVGGSARFDEQLRNALKAVLSGEDKKSE